MINNRSIRLRCRIKVKQFFVLPNPSYRNKLEEYNSSGILQYQTKPHDTFTIPTECNI